MLNSIEVVWTNKFFKFMSIGAITTLLHVTIYGVLVSLVLLGSQLANIAAFVIAFLFSFLGQTFVTFKQSREYVSLTLLAKFLLTSSVSYLLNALWVAITDSVLNIHPAWAMVGMGLITPPVSYILFENWVFKRKQQVDLR